MVFFLVILLLIAEYGFFVPQQFSELVDIISRIVVWLFVSNYILNLFIATFDCYESRSFGPMRRHLRFKWIHLVLSFFIVFQQSFFFSWIQLPAIASFVSSDYRLMTKLYIAFTQIFILMGFGVSFVKYSARFAALRFHPAQSLLLSFIILIVIGCVCLLMPKAVRPGMELTFFQALFTSTSAVCITGLTVVDTVQTFSVTGQIVILILIQLGGIGVITFATFFSMYFGGGISVKERIMVRDLLNEETFDEAAKTLRQIVFITILIETAGAIALYYQWSPPDVTVKERMYSAVFHSVSSFCNAGFALWTDSLMGADKSWGYKSVIALLIVTGGLGFSVMRNLLSVAYARTIGAVIAKFHVFLIRKTQNGVSESDDKEGSSSPFSQTIRLILENYRTGLSVQSKFVLVVSTSLITLGLAGFLFLEWNHAFQAMSCWDKIGHALFQSITARTAGFNTVDLTLLSMPSVILMIFLMFIGASPGSTGGGIKTTTFAIMMASSFGNLRGTAHVNVFKKRIPDSVILRSLMVVTFSLLLVFGAIFVLSISESDIAIHRLTFEAVSAFATVGLSTGITANLSPIGLLVIIILMILGRIGPLSIALAAVPSHTAQEKEYPTEAIMIG